MTDKDIVKKEEASLDLESIKKVLQEELINNTIDISALQQGMYVVEVVGVNWRVWKKLIIN